MPKNGLRVERHGTQAPTAPDPLHAPVILGQEHLAQSTHETLPSDWRTVRETQDTEKASDG
jgi:hypothetical protein